MMTDAEALAHGLRSFRRLTDGRYVGYYRLFFTDRIVVGTRAECYDNCWCYEHGAAEAALGRWVAGGAVDEPAGWHRHPPSGRRRPGGDRAQEYIND